MKKAVFTPGVNSLRMMYGWKPLPNAAWILIFTPPGKEGWTRSSLGISFDCGVSKEFLKRNGYAPREGIVTPNCKRQCQGCGAAVSAEGLF